MKKIELISEGNKYSAINVGSLEKLHEHSLTHPVSGQEIKGKVFLKNPTKSTGSEISFSTIPPKTELPIFHTHFENEETYIILKGEGDFQVGENCFPIKEGSVVRVATDVSRGLRNSSNGTMVYMVIQVKEGGLNQYSADDSAITEFNPKWK